MGAVDSGGVAIGTVKRGVVADRRGGMEMETEDNSGTWNETPCIVYGKYRQDGGKGYGEIVVRQKRWLAHRYAWFLVHGEIPNGLFVCHRCNNKGCISVKHLYLATNRQNILDAKRDGLLTNKNAKKTCCSVCGGAFSTNKYGRYCKPCKRASDRKTKRLRKELAAMSTKP